MAMDPMSEMFQVDAEVTFLAELSPGYFLLRMLAPEIARAAQPGQFVQLRVGPVGSIDPLLARPISIFRAHAATGELSFIFKTVGRGTTLLSASEVGTRHTILGPIGNGFHIPPATTRLALVAGGVGMPPLFFLAETLRHTRPALAQTVFYGGRSAADLLCLSDWAALGVRVITATDDGSAGEHGLITAPLARAVAAGAVDYLAACGPRPMLRAVQQLALDAGIPGELSLEARMACGVGACLGCVCGTAAGHRRVCVDGPVFPLAEVLIDG